MIIDDEKDIVFLLRDYFTFNDYDVVTAYDTAEASEKLSEKPDLILLDINMPRKNGLDFCKQIRNQTDAPIIFLTARAEETDILAGLNVGGDNSVITEHIRKIREKFADAGRDSYIETVWGLGYKWVK